MSYQARYDIINRCNQNRRANITAATRLRDADLEACNSDLRRLRRHFQGTQQQFDDACHDIKQEKDTILMFFRIDCDYEKEVYEDHKVRFWIVL